MESDNFENLKIYDYFGVEEIDISGVYSVDTFIKKLSEEWIPFIECQSDCGRSDYCKFAAGKNEEVRCGVASKALRDFIKVTFIKFNELEIDKKQNFLHSLYYLISFIYKYETQIGLIIYDEFISHFKQYAPFVFTSIIDSRDILNEASKQLKSLSDFHYNKGVLFVEGKTELIFLSEMKKTRMSFFLNLNINSYDGKDNARLRRIEMLLKDYNDNGYDIYICGDADGSDNKFSNLIDKSLVLKANTFAFPYDIESSIPDDVFLKILHNNGILNDVSLEDYLIKANKCKFGEDRESVFDFINREFDIDIKSRKIIIAKSLAKYYSDKNYSWWQYPKFMNTVFGQFFNFIINIPK